MDIKQFEDKSLAHFSYAVCNEATNEIILIDPARNIKPYLDLAASLQARITHVIETHPHADFVSGHLELHETTGAVLHCSRLVGAAYPHIGFDEGDEIVSGDITLKALNTPGHSPDSICVVLEYVGVPGVVFTGDTLFIGDCGRPDLREQAGNLTARKEELARSMYHSLREKLMPLPDDTLVYPAHGAGTLCGKSLSDADSSTIAIEKISNWCLQDDTEDEFVAELLARQPFVPAYFPYDVAVNRVGAPPLAASLAKVPRIDGTPVLEEQVPVVDTRPVTAFREGAQPGAINLQNGGKFETWLGSIIGPDEQFYLLAATAQQLTEVMEKTARIGYESKIKAALVYTQGAAQLEVLPLDDFKAHPERYTVVDVRMSSEAADYPIFQQALSIPLDELRKRVTEIPVTKPVVIHCAGGYRSAAATSIVAAALKDKVPVYDLGEAVKQFYPGEK